MSRRISSARTRLGAKCLAALAVIALGTVAREASATENDGSGTFAEVSAGRAFARFLPLEDADTDAEHFAVSGHQVSLGFGYGYDLGARRSWRAPPVPATVGQRQLQLYVLTAQLALRAKL